MRVHWETDLIGAIGIALGIAGLLYAAWARRHPRTDVHISYEARSSSYRLHSRNPDRGIADRVQLAFDGTPVERVTVTDVAFLNGGPSRLNEDDEERPVLIEFGTGGVILDVAPSEVESEGRHSVKVRLAPMNNGETKTFTIVHTYPESHQPSIDAQLRNVPDGVVPYSGGLSSHPITHAAIASFKWIYIVFAFTFLPLTLGYSVIDSLSSFDSWPQWSRLVTAFPVGLALAGVFAGFFVLLVKTTERLGRVLRRGSPIDRASGLAEK